MTDLANKKKSHITPESTQNVAKTLKMFQVMDAKEKISQIQAETKKVVLKSESKSDKKENRETHGKMNQLANADPKKEEASSPNKSEDKFVSGMSKSLPNKNSSISGNDNGKNSSKVGRSSSTKDIVNRYQNKLNVDNSSYGNESSIKRHSTDPSGKIQNSFQPDFMNKVNLGLMKQMKSKLSEEKVVNVFKSVVTSSDNDRSDHMKETKEEGSNPGNEANKSNLIGFEQLASIKLKTVQNRKKSIDTMDFDLIQVHEKLAHPTITRARPSKKLKQRRLPSRYSQIQSS